MMKRFLIQVSIFIAVLALFKGVQTALAWNGMSSKDASNFYGQNTGKPKIILVGSSNLDFNYDYGFLDKIFVDYDVVGCNLNEPSGLYPTLYKLRRLNPQKDDILIFCLPHSHYEPTKFIPLGSSGKKGYTTEMLTEGFKEFPMKFAESIIDIKTTDTFNLLGENASYDARDDSNQFDTEMEADAYSDFRECKKLDGNFDISSSGFDEEYLIELHNYLQDTFPSQILFRFPAVKEFEFAVDKKRLEFLSANFEFLNSFEESVYSDEFWYNQWYHLNYCGRETNTGKLIGELNEYLNR